MSGGILSRGDFVLDSLDGLDSRKTHVVEPCSLNVNPGHNATGQSATNKNHPGQNAIQEMNGDKRMKIRSF